MHQAKQEFQILHAFRPFLRVLMIYHPIKLCPSESSHFIGNLFHAFIFTIVLIGFWMYLIWATLFCIDEDFNLQKVIQPFSISLPSFQAFLNFVAISFKARDICDALDQLQGIIERRKTQFWGVFRVSRGSFFPRAYEKWKSVNF